MQGTNSLQSLMPYRHQAVFPGSIAPDTRLLTATLHNDNTRRSLEH